VKRCALRGRRYAPQHGSDAWPQFQIDRLLTCFPLFIRSQSDNTRALFDGHVKADAGPGKRKIGSP